MMVLIAAKPMRCDVGRLLERNSPLLNVLQPARPVWQWLSSWFNEELYKCSLYPSLRACCYC